MPSLTKQNNKPNIPALRFPGFSGEWEKDSFGSAVNLRNEKYAGGENSESKRSIELESLEKGSGKLKKTFDTKGLKSIKNVVYKGDVLYGKLRPYLRKYYKADFDGVCTTEIWVFRGNKFDNSFLFYFIQTDRFNYHTNISTGSRMPRSDWGYVSSIPVTIPPLPEQHKIASVLTAVDKWCDNLRAQKENLEEYKKGMMQKIFPAKGGQVSEIRFKRDDGKDFPAWEEKRLGEICEIKKGKQLNKSSLSDSGEYPVINGGVGPSGFTNKYNTEGDIITISEGGNSCGFVNYIKVYFWCGGHCYSLNNADLSKMYLFYFLKYKEKEIMRLRVGSGLPNIQRVDIEKIRIAIPSSLEQQKIAKFLTSIDNLINKKQHQVTQAEKWKQGLMQGLFV